MTWPAGGQALVPGDPDQVDRLARDDARYAAGATDAARALRRIDTGSWVGPAGDSFRSAIGELPDTLARGEGAFADASAALAAYGEVLRGAQAQAAQASREHDQAQADTSRWHRLPPEQRAVDDPGAEGRARADRLLHDARTQVEAAAVRAAAAVDGACHGAPHEPGLLSRAVHVVGSFLQGAGEATWSLVELAVTTSPTYALIDPQGWLDHTEQLGRGLLAGVEHPDQLARAVLDVDTWEHDPARALGHLVPDLLLAVATAGTGEAGVAGARVAEGAVAADELAVRGAGAAARAEGLGEETAAALEARFGSPAEGALEFQGQGLYPGRDSWSDGLLRPGDTFAVGSPGEGRFAATADSVTAVGTDARAYNEGLQVAAKRFPDGVDRYRPRLQTYQVHRPLPVGESVAMANPQYGAGGLRQLYLPDDLPVLVDEGYLSHHSTIELTGTGSRIPPEGLADDAGQPGRAMMAAGGEHVARQPVPTGGCR